MSAALFDRLADRYDAWFDSPRGAAIFAAEVDCLRSLMPDDPSGWIEVGVGTGRFAEALGVPEGVDPSTAVLGKAAARGVRTVRAAAEELPCPSGSRSGVLLVVTLCFLDAPGPAMAEFARVLRDGGRLLVGIVPADSGWGRHYRRLARQGHPFYSAATFYTCREAVDLARAAGFRLVDQASTLAMGPDEPVREAEVVADAGPAYGFAGLLFANDAAKTT